MTGAMRMLRPIVIVLGNIVTALIGTAILESDLWHIVPSTAVSTLNAKEYVVSTFIPLALGYFVFWKWRYPAAKWVWIAGVVWFGQRALLYWVSEAPSRLLGVRHSVFREMSGIGCINGEWLSCNDFLGYTVLCIRIVFYSAGAWCCSIWRWPRKDGGSGEPATGNA
jgi:hypothetical protein